MSAFFPGHTHDFTIFKEVFAGFDFSGLRIHVDLGFVGIQKAVQTINVNIPHTKPLQMLLTIRQKAENVALSRLRVVIENSFAKMKSLFVLRIENRMKNKQRLDEAMKLYAGLAKFKNHKSFYFGV
ncbi:MAG: hypothetical protein M3Y54_08230 [Bacteroidota bacterium]|nr:hypothetical protein [Bacteroidota bacterium]